MTAETGVGAAAGTAVPSETAAAHEHRKAGRKGLRELGKRGKLCRKPVYVITAGHEPRRRGKRHTKGREKVP